MIRKIVKDCFALSQKSVTATRDDLYIIDDLIDTITFHQQRCVGMAANMIGYNKRIIVVNDHGQYLVMLNPRIIKTKGQTYKAQEGCLCHTGIKEATRYECVKVEYDDRFFHKRVKMFDQQTSQIIQHELDHLAGILI